MFWRKWTPTCETITRVKTVNISVTLKTSSRPFGTLPSTTPHPTPSGIPICYPALLRCFAFSKSLYKWNYNTVCSFCVFRSASIGHSFLLLSTIPYDGSNTICYSLVDGHLVCFQLLAITMKASINIHVQVFKWTKPSFILGRSGVPGSESRCMFNFLRNHGNVFQSSCTVLHSHQLGRRVPVHLPPWHHMAWSDLVFSNF